MRAIVIGFATSAVIAATAAAQDTEEEIDFCNVDPEIYSTVLAERLVGAWQVRNLQGYLVRNGQRVALPPLVETTETMSIIGGELSFTMDDGQGPFAIRFIDPGEEGWTIDPDPDDPTENEVALSSGDMALAQGCESDQDFVRLYVEGTNMSEAGPVNFKVRMFVVNDFTIYGVVEGTVPGQNMMARRVMQATKL
ncbi:hypothetical protein [Aliiroseovarius sp. YM-037]|uniref:hypothetical protein n=1 Tax=Aliiroseovarius sp. YM-037 TaxID=3341728 RepID=UPI003A80EF86